MIRVVVADDEALVRAGVRAVVTAQGDIEVVGEAGDGPEAVRLVGRLLPDVVLLDVRMPGGDGLDAAARIRRSHPETAVVMLTLFDEDAYVSAALDDGVSGFLLKTGDPEELLTGVRAAAEGGAFLSPKVARRVVDLIGSRAEAPPPGPGSGWPRSASGSARCCPWWERD